MSDFAGTMRRLTEELRGCRSAFLMDYDGLPVEILRSEPNGTDPDAVGAELATVLREAREAALELGLGRLHGLSVRGEGPTLIFQDSGRDYLLVAVLERASSAVVARRALAAAARDASLSP